MQDSITKSSGGARAVLGVLAALALCSAANARDLSGRKDVAGSADHRMISRYPGSVIVNYLQRDYDAFRLPAGKAVSDGREWKPERARELEGRLTRLRYAAPEGRSALEVFRNYEAALDEAGFEALYACAGDECGKMASTLPRMEDDRGTDLMGKNQRFFAGRARTAEADVFVSLLVIENDVNWLSGHPVVQLDVVETTAMDEGLVDVDLSAAEMMRRIDASGHVSLYGIYFDTDEATVKAESAPTLAAIAELLAGQPELGLWVVGHTDGQGTLEHNMGLSRRRAAAVVRALASDHGVAAGRLEGHGVGPLAPVATNATAEGRAENRRVELVRRFASPRDLAAGPPSGPRI